MRVWYRAQGGADAAIQTLIYATAPIWIPVGALALAWVGISGAYADYKAEQHAKKPEVIAQQRALDAELAQAEKAEAARQAEIAKGQRIAAELERVRIATLPWPPLKCQALRKAYQQHKHWAINYGMVTYADKALAEKADIDNHCGE